jgi:DNA-directed RNA polymerase specialized sigma24 family protein
VKGITAAVRCRVEIDFDPGRGVPMEAFVYLRALSCAWTRYRQECAYARRFIHANGRDTPAEVDVSFAEDCHPTDSLRCALGKLPFADQWLIRQLFWAKTPQGEIARDLRISQQAVSKRKRKIIGKLREVLGEVAAIIVLWGEPFWSDLACPVESLLFCELWL